MTEFMIFTKDQLSNEDYHRAIDPDGRPVITSSKFKKFLPICATYDTPSSPELFNAQFVAKTMPGDHETRAKALGSAVHARFEGNDPADGERIFNERYVLYPKDVLGKSGGATTKAAEAFAETIAKAGKTAITPDDADISRKLVLKAYETPETRALLKDTEPEMTIRVKHPSGLWMQARFDRWGSDGSMSMRSVDHKTTESLERFKRAAVYDYHYHISDAFYRTVLHQATKVPPESVNSKYLVMETSPLHRLAIADFGDHRDSLQTDLSAVDNGMHQLAACFRDNRWEGDVRKMTFRTHPYAVDMT